jgi:hypothetical protein
VGLNPFLKRDRQFEEVRVEVAGEDLQRGAHWPAGVWRVRE